MCKRTSSLKFSIPQQPTANAHTVHGFSWIGLVVRLFSCIFLCSFFSHFSWLLLKLSNSENSTHHSLVDKWKIHSIHSPWAWAYFPSLRLCVMPSRKCIRHDELEILFLAVMNVQNTWPLNFTLFLLWVERESRQQTGFYSTEMSEIAFCNDEPYSFVNIWRISTVMYDQNIVRKIKFASK